MDLVVQSTTKPRRYTVINYCLDNDFAVHRSSQDIDPDDKIILTAQNSKMFYYSNNVISLLNGKLTNRSWKLTIYYLDTEAPTYALWRPLLNSRFVIIESVFDFKNSIPVLQGNNEVIIASVLKDRISFHSFVLGKKGVSSTISQLPNLYTTEKYKLQSCIIISNHIYCSLLLYGEKASIYKFSIRSLHQHHKRGIPICPQHTWHIKRDTRTLTNCFVSVHKEEEPIIIICCYVVHDKSILEVKKPAANCTEVSSTEYTYEFPYIVKIISTSVVPYFENLVIAVIYQESENNKYYIKRIEMSSNTCI